MLPSFKNVPSIYYLIIMALAIEEVMSSNLYTQQVKKLQKIAEILGLDDSLVQVLSIPERVIQVKIPVRTKNGKVKTFLGWRVQHNSALGPYKGGLRYHPAVTQEEVTALAMIMTWKNSLLGLPYGGGKGGIRVDPSTLTEDELEELTRNYVDAISRDIGSDLDIPAPDVNTDSRIMAWFVDEYIRITGKVDYAIVTGKPKNLGGLETRIISTGLGVATIALEAMETFLGGYEGKRVAIQGFGNVGSNAVRFLEENKVKVIAVSDAKGGVYNPEGLSYEKLMEVKNKTGSVVNYPGAKVITNEQLLEADVDVLIPAAIENVITKLNASRVKAKVIVEGANGPLTADADEIMKQRGVYVIPDILANAGGVVVSHIEWANNKMGQVISEEEAKDRLIREMKSAYKAVINEWRTLGNYDIRTAAMSLAVRRVYEAMKSRGQF